jgi:hypothetical protein
MGDVLGTTARERMQSVLMIVTIASMLIGLGVTWATLGAEITALQVADVGLRANDTRIDAAQLRTEIVALDNQRALAAIDAKIDILLSERDRRAAP